MELLKERIIIFVGAFGSGKTELALNYTLELADRGEKVAIVDLDLVSPYFRSRDIRESLTAQGVEVIAPPGELALADLPIILPRIQGALLDPNLNVVVDVGGDEAGATALGRFSEQLKSLPHQLLLVINTCRPFTRDLSGIAAMLAGIERSTRLKVTGLVSNSNLGPETTPEIVRSGLTVVQAVGQALSITVVGVGVHRDLVPVTGPLAAPVIPLNIQLLPPWLRA